MYTDEDLNYAVEKGVFTASSVEEFRSLLSMSKNSPSVDEENFRLIGGFNDIFVVIACSLLLFSTVWVLKTVNESLGFLVFAILAWALAEFFVLKRKMALPAIMLLLSFVGGIFVFSRSLFSSPSELSFIFAAAISTIAAYFHWVRFKVPITIAVGSGAVVAFFVLGAITILPEAKDWLSAILFFFGLGVFMFAMYWDSSDINRTTGRSDVAFWLHLLSAPLIIHPVFSSLGILDGNESLKNMAVVIVVYLLITSISIAVDRRAFMVSSLVYVLYAISSIIKSYGGVGYSFALTGVLMGGALLFLSAFWHPVRAHLVSKLPYLVQGYIPKVKAV
jgi:hypothetical protein